ncbi:MAG: hypothetical protein HKO70_05725 [Acidimicrobiia bacterium]|nr:hypothetical protein [Acidimicrobiia bacterium]
MPDFVKKIKKARSDDLTAGEELLAATVGQPMGTFSRQALGGIVGVLASKKMADRKLATLDGAGDSGLAATVPADQQLVIAVTDRRVLFYIQGMMSGAPKELATAIDIADVHEMSLEKHKMTSALTIRFSDNSARMLECVKMAKPQDVVEAFNRTKGSKAA